jgi:5-methylcytosine-specific restriction protein A
MPTRPLKQCSGPACGATTDGPYCAAHSVRLEDRGSAAARGYGHRWRKRRLHWLSQHPLCARCEEKDLVKPATDVHHRKPLSEGGADDESNYESLCHECHSAETREHARAKSIGG